VKEVGLIQDMMLHCASNRIMFSTRYNLDRIPQPTSIHKQGKRLWHENTLSPRRSRPAPPPPYSLYGHPNPLILDHIPYESLILPLPASFSSSIEGTLLFVVLARADLRFSLGPGMSLAAVMLFSASSLNVRSQLTPPFAARFPPTPPSLNLFRSTSSEREGFYLPSSPSSSSSPLLRVPNSSFSPSPCEVEQTPRHPHHHCSQIPRAFRRYNTPFPYSS